MAWLLGGLACGVGDRDPRSLLPAEADAVLAFPGVERLEREAGPFFERVPEAAGVTEWMRSMTGIDLRSAARTREEGFDPGRPWGVAFRSGEWWVAFPVADPGTVRRRLGLRLARFGMVTRREEGDWRLYEDLRDARHRALVRVERDVARVCASWEGGCGRPDQVGVSGPGTARALEALGHETGLRAPAVVFRLGRRALEALLPGTWRAALPTGMVGEMLWATLGDLRGALEWTPSPTLRVLVGSVAGPLDLAETPLALQPGEVATVVLDLGTLAEVLRGPATRWTGTLGPFSGVLSAWDGRMRASLGIRPGATAGDRRTVPLRERLSLEARFGVRVGATRDAPAGAPGALGAEGTDRPEGSLEVAGIRGWWPGIGSVSGALRGQEFVVVSGEVVPALGDSASWGPLPGRLPGLVAWARVDWRRLVQALGGESLGLPGHLAAVLGEVEARVLQAGGRWVAEVRVAGRSEGDQ